MLYFALVVSFQLNNWCDFQRSSKVNNADTVRLIIFTEWHYENLYPYNLQRGVGDNAMWWCVIRSLAIILVLTSLKVLTSSYTNYTVSQKTVPVLFF